MNVLMLTNTFFPHVGGVAESIARFAGAYREAGHEVLIVAPWFEGSHVDEPGILRVPAWEHLLDTDFSLPLPLPGHLHSQVHLFSPDIVHSHHPFLLGDTALRVAASENVPIVFTNHTQYDVYSHYLRKNSNFLRRFATKIAVGYGNLCDAVVAPSESIRDRLLSAGVETRLEVVPTGVDVAQFSRGDGGRCRRGAGIPSDAFVVGHIGRLAAEKNLGFLSKAVADFVAHEPRAWMFVAGKGPLASSFIEAFADRGVGARLVMRGILSRTELCDAYAAMDAFAFSSQSETQGMVLAEAMAAGTPVVAVDAPGVREVVRDRINGRLLATEDHGEFVSALKWIAARSPDEGLLLSHGARRTAEEFSMPRCAAKALDLYTELIQGRSRQQEPDDFLHGVVRRVAQECRLWANVAEAGATSVLGEGEK